TLVEKRERVIDSLDAEISEALRVRMEDMGVTVLMPDAVAAVQSKEQLEVQLESGGALSVDTILVSSGRCGETEALGLTKLGIKVDKRGRILVNEHYQTSVPHIYAAGDVIGAPALASTSMEQARVAMVHAFDLKFRKDVSTILPYGIFTIP